MGAEAYEPPRSFSVCDLMEFLQKEISEHNQYIEQHRRTPCVVTHERVQERRRKIDALQATLAMLTAMDGRISDLKEDRETLYELVEATGWGREPDEPSPEEAGLSVLTALRRWYSEQADKTLQSFLKMKRASARRRG